MSSSGFNFVANKHDNDMHKYVRDMIICISVYRGSILIPSRIWLVYSKFYFFFTFEESGLKHRKHMRVMWGSKGLWRVAKIFSTEYDSILYSVSSASG